MSYLQQKYIISLVVLGFLFLGLSGCSEEDKAPVSQSEELSTDELEIAVEDFGDLVADPVEGILSHWMDDVDSPGVLQNDLKNDHDIADTVIVRDNLTISIDLTFFDSEGTESEIYDPLSTVRMTKNVTIEGARENPQRTTTINGSNFHDISGIAPEDTLRTINSNGTRAVESTFEGRLREVTVTFAGEHDWTASDVLVSRDRETSPYPLSGTIDATDTIYRRVELPNGTRTLEFETNFTVTFDGSQYAEIYVVEFDRTFWIDLENGDVYRIRPE
ncbi:hypothetical protein K8I28_10295 [bacterium]|nr:hypothetical protein [bacterium]